MLIYTYIKWYVIIICIWTKPAAARARGGPCGRTHNIGLGPEVVHLSVNYEPANCERRCFGRGEEDDIPMNRSVGVFVRHRCHAPGHRHPGGYTAKILHGFKTVHRHRRGMGWTELQCRNFRPAQYIILLASSWGYYNNNRIITGVF